MMMTCLVDTIKPGVNCWLPSGEALQEVLVSEANAGFQIDLWPPAQGEQARAIHELARHAVRFGRVPNDFPAKADNPLHGLRQLAHGNLPAGPDVDELLLAVVLQQEKACSGEVIRIEELTQR